MPLFHGNALMGLWGPAVNVGSAIAVRPRFSASAFLDDVRLFGATKFSYVGKAIAYILATPERPDDAENTLTSAFGTEASVRDRSRFRKRFGCYLIEGYGQSEGGAAINPTADMPRGALGRPVDGVDLAVISPDTGEECARGPLRRRRPAAQRRRGHRRDRQPQRAGQVRGLLPARGRGAGAVAARVVLDRRPGLRRRRTASSTSPAATATGFGSTRRTSPPGRSRRCSSRNPDLAVVAVYPVPDTVSGAGDQVMVAIEMAPGITLRSRQRSPRGSRPNPTWDPSGSPATSGSRTPCPRRPRAR